MADKHYLNEVKEFIDSAELRCNGDYQFEAGSRRLTSSNGLHIFESIPHCSSVEHQSLCAAKLSNEESVSNYDIQRAVDYLSFQIELLYVLTVIVLSRLYSFYNNHKMKLSVVRKFGAVVQKKRTTFKHVEVRSHLERWPVVVKCHEQLKNSSISFVVLVYVLILFEEKKRSVSGIFFHLSVMSSLLDDDFSRNFVNLFSINMHHSQQEREVMKSDDDSDSNEVYMAAQVGLILLKRNGELEKTNESLEKKLVEANEEMTQLKHELQLKLSLLRALAEEEEDQIINDSYYGLSYQDLQAKMKNLEEQNQKLQLEISHLKDIVASSVDREELLAVRYCKQRSDSQSKIQNLCEQLNEGKQVCMLQQSFLENLHKEIEDLHLLNSKLREENAELSQQLQSFQSMYTAVKTEMQKMERRYEALWDSLIEAESETKTLVANSDIELSGIQCGSAYVSLATELMNHCERNKTRRSKSPVSFQTNTNTTKLMKKALKWQLAMDSPTSVKFTVPVSSMLVRSPPAMEMPSPLMMIESTTPLPVSKIPLEPMTMIKSTPPPIQKKSSKPLMMIESTPPPPPSPPSSSSLGQSPWQSPAPLEMVVDETDRSRCSELDPPSSESVSSRCPTPEYGVPGVPGTKDLVRAIRRLKLKALQRSLSKQTTNPDEEIAASADVDHPVEVEDSGGLLGRIQRWLTCSLMPSCDKTLPQWSAACFVNTTGTYSFVNSQVLHPQVDSRLYNVPGLSFASKLTFGSYPLISAPLIVSSSRCCSCGQEVNSFDLVNNANTKRGTVVVNGGDSACLWTAEPGSATNCTWVRHMVVMPVFTKLYTDDANQNTGNKAE
ncbi:Trafficking kinesin-binding protein 1 [Trichinella spiralis]|uniref:Trafficking kinesin-binding protein 1 n=2 Tax=Trichinella spiralis TaxID=6334 RepID=A0A0V1AX42_TRISP|nr:Trafficking kinesin-binding protein 1 [Trichinella spiralis]